MKQIRIIICFLVFALISQPLVVLKFQNAYAQQTDASEYDEGEDGPSDSGDAVEYTGIEPSATSPIYDPELLVQYMNAVSKKPLLKINGVDIEAIRNFETDVRARDLLLELVKPEAFGGNGHKLKVSRIEKNYNTDKKALTKETDFTEFGLDQDDANKSPHHDAKAIDIVEIDEFQCSTKGITGTKKTKPQPIKVAWQTKETGEQLGGEGSDRLGSNFIEVAKNMFSNAIYDGLSDDVDLSIERFRSQDANIAGIIFGLGQAKYNEELGIAIQGSGDFSETLKATGQGILSAQTGFSKIAFAGKNSSQFKQNIGKAKVEKDLQLIDGFLMGDNPDEWLKSGGKRIVENVMGLRPGSITDKRVNQGLSGIASAKIETYSEIPTGSWSSNKKDIEKNTSLKLDSIFYAPATADKILDIEAGSTKKLVDGQLGPGDYTRLVEKSIKKNNQDLFANGKLADNAWGAPKETIVKIFAGSEAGYKMLGAQNLSNSLLFRDEDNLNLQNQARSGSISEIAAENSPVQISITSQRFIDIFGSDQNKRAKALENLGEETLSNSIIPTSTTNLYLGFKPSDLKTLVEKNKSIDSYVSDMGKRFLEYNYDLEEGDIKDNGKLSDKDAQKVANQINTETLLNKTYKDAKDYQITTSDVRSLFDGKPGPIISKLGAQEFEKGISALPGDGQDFMFGRTDEDTIFANAGLVELAKIAGMEINTETVGKPDAQSGSQKRTEHLADIIKLNSDFYKKDFMKSWFEFESYGIKYDLDGILSDIKNIDNDLQKLKTDLFGLKSTILSSKAGLDKDTIEKLILGENPTDTIIKEGSKYLSEAIGISDKSLYKVYTDPSAGIDSIINHIKEKTGIEIDKDARKFTVGDMEGALTSWGLAEFKKEVNKDVSNPVMAIAYDTISKSVFGDDQELSNKINQAKATGEAIQKIDINISARDVLKNFQATANFAVVDAQLSKTNPSIPKGFTETMMHGTEEQKYASLKEFGLKQAGFSDAGLSEITGITIPEGTSAKLNQFVQNKISYDQLQTDLANFGEGFGKNLAFGWGDKTLGLEAGTSNKIYDTYNSYKQLEGAYTAGKMSASQFQLNQVALAVTAIDIVTGGAITKLTSPLDEALGLPPGTLLNAALIVAAGFPPAAIAMVVFQAAQMLLKGDIDSLLLTFTPLFFLRFFGFGKMKCPDPTKLARKKINTVLTEVTEISKREKAQSTSDYPVFANQIRTWKWGDDSVDYLQSIVPIAEDLFGENGQFDKAGFGKTLTPDHIHIGF